MLLYLAGHGIARQQEFYFLTDGASRNDLDDSALLRINSVSGADLADMLIAIPARKQVMILDTCHAGQAVSTLISKAGESARQLAPRSASEDPENIIAWEQMQKATGLMILAGSSADGTSHESASLGHGVLTYSLLKSLKYSDVLVESGGSDKEYVDVSRWLAEAKRAVPEIARGLGGSQDPHLRSDTDVGTILIGRLLPSDRERIPFSLPKPVLLSSLFLDAGMEDSLGFSALVDSAARALGRGEHAPLVLEPELKGQPGRYQLRGSYALEDDTLSLRVILYTWDSKLESRKLWQETLREDRSKLDDLAQRVVSEARRQIR